MKTTPKVITKLIKLPLSMVEIEGEVDAETLEKSRAEAIKNLQKEVKVDGFRQGKVPESVIVTKVGEQGILEEAAEIALQKAMPVIAKEHKLDILGRPEVTLTKVARNNPLGFKIKMSVVPEVKLPDHKKIAVKHNKEPEMIPEVTEADVDAVIQQVRQSKAVAEHKKMHEDGTEHMEKTLEETLPELTDAFAQSVGSFKTVAEMKAKIKENLGEEKKTKAKDKKRMDLVEKIVDDTKIELPEILVDSELRKMVTQFEYDIEQAGIPVDEYLKHIKKTTDDLQKEWRKDAEKRAKVQLIFNQIAQEEKLFPTAEEIEKEAKNILEHYKEADINNVRAYVATVLMNEKVFKFLEDQK